MADTGVVSTAGMAAGFTAGLVASILATMDMAISHTVTTVTDRARDSRLFHRLKTARSTISSFRALAKRHFRASSLRLPERLAVMLAARRFCGDLQLFI